jgi:Uma2 family endonuclease
VAVSIIDTRRKLFSIDEYEQMVQSGVLSEDERLELIEGEIFAMSPIGSLHVVVVNRLTNLLARQLGERAIVSVQNPIRLTTSEPQPDVTVLHPETDNHPERLPAAEDIFLVIEVCDSSSAYDRQIKVPLYAREGLAEVWLVDLEQKTVEVFREPGLVDFREKRTFSSGASLAPAAFPDATLVISTLFAKT